MIEYIKYNEEILAILIKQNYKKDGIEFFTPDEFSQQLGYMNRPKNYEIPPHTHNEVVRKVKLTQEVLFLKKGKVRVDFYTSKKEYLESKIISTGDVVLLANGGHGFKMLEDSELIEVKQGPYVEEVDKVRFNKVEEDFIKFK